MLFHQIELRYLMALIGIMYSSNLKQVKDWILSKLMVFYISLRKEMELRGGIYPTVYDLANGLQQIIFTAILSPHFMSQGTNYYLPLKMQVLHALTGILGFGYPLGTTTTGLIQTVSLM